MQRATRVRLTLFLAVMAWLMVLPSAQAYIDPGSTSIIFQALVAGHRRRRHGPGDVLGADRLVLPAGRQGLHRGRAVDREGLSAWAPPPRVWPGRSATRPVSCSSATASCTARSTAASPTPGTPSSTPACTTCCTTAACWSPTRSSTPRWAPTAPTWCIRPERLPVLSFPYEWAPGQLRDAALLTLEIQSVALEHGMVLRDASAYNVQFRRGRPVFIDTLSFEPWEEGTPWVAYGQFCEHFLAPLALQTKVDHRLRRLLVADIGGVPLDLAAELLPGRTKLSPGAADPPAPARARPRRDGHRGRPGRRARAGDGSRATPWSGWSVGCARPSTPLTLGRCRARPGRTTTRPPITTTPTLARPRSRPSVTPSPQVRPDLGLGPRRQHRPLRRDRRRVRRDRGGLGPRRRGGRTCLAARQRRRRRPPATWSRWCRTWPTRPRRWAGPTRNARRWPTAVRWTSCSRWRWSTTSPSATTSRWPT